MSDKCFSEKISSGEILVYPTETDFADALENPSQRLKEIMDSTQSLIFGPVYTDDRLKDNQYIPVMDVGLEYWEQVRLLSVRYTCSSCNRMGLNWGTRIILVLTFAFAQATPFMPKTPQAIFEWVELYGAMFNKENRARKLTFIKEKRWQCVENKVANIWSPELFQSRSAKKPKVCWAYHLDYQSDWGNYYGWVWANPCRYVFFAIAIFCLSKYVVVVCVYVCSMHAL